MSSYDSVCSLDIFLLDLPLIFHVTGRYLLYIVVHCAIFLSMLPNPLLISWTLTILFTFQSIEIQKRIGAFSAAMDTINKCLSEALCALSRGRLDGESRITGLIHSGNEILETFKYFPEIRFLVLTFFIFLAKQAIFSLMLKNCIILRIYHLYYAWCSTWSSFFNCAGCFYKV